MSNQSKPSRHEIHDLIERRWSPRAYSDRNVEPDKLASLFEAARWAPSCFNEQPWRFLVADKGNPAEYAKLFDCMVEANQVWAGAAPVLVLSVASLNFGRNGKPNRHAMHDTGLAVENLVLQATALGLATHQMAGFDMDKARVGFGLGPEFEPAAMIAIGYPGDPDALPEPLRERESAPRDRKPLSDLVFQGSVTTPAPGLD